MSARSHLRRTGNLKEARVPTTRPTLRKLLLACLLCLAVFAALALLVAHFRKS